MTDVRLKISPPWITYVNKLSAIFDEDPQIAFNTNLGDGTYEVVLATNNPEKARQPHLNGFFQKKKSLAILLLLLVLIVIK